MGGQIVEQPVVSLADRQPERGRIMQEVVDAALSMRGEFTIYEMYAKFPGRNPVVQNVLTNLTAAGMFEKPARGVYRRTEDINAYLYARVRELEAKERELMEANYELALQNERMAEGLNELRDVVNTNMRLRVQLSQANEELKNLTGQRKLHAVR